MTLYSRIARLMTRLADRTRMYVTADPSDSSVTLSPALLRHIRRSAGQDEGAKVLVFRIRGDGRYGFTVNPALERPAALCAVQYNPMLRCVGFETLRPTVARVLYDYGLGAEAAVRLPVSARTDGRGRIYYRMERPVEKDS